MKLFTDCKGEIRCRVAGKGGRYWGGEGLLEEEGEEGGFSIAIVFALPWDSAAAAAADLRSCLTTAEAVTAAALLPWAAWLVNLSKTDGLLG